MEWTKIKTKHFLFTNYTSKEKGDLVTLMCLTAQLEHLPLREEMVKVVHYKALTHLQDMLNRRSMTLQDILNKVLEDVSKVKHKRDISRVTTKRHRDRGKVGDASCDTTDKIREDKSITNVMSQFESLWNKYPRKDGKKEAIKHFQTSVKTESDITNIRAALEKYTNYVKKNKIEERYIKKGSTWFNNWQDWIDYKESVVTKKEHILGE